MSEKTNMVSVNAFEKVMNEHFQDSVVVDWCGLKITIKKYIDVDAMHEFVMQASNNCFGDNYEYVPDMKDFSIRACMVEKYSNIRLPENARKMYEFVYRTDICDCIYDNINQTQLDVIRDAIDERIAYLTDGNIAEVREAVKTVSKISDDIAGMFAGVTPDDIKNLVNATASGKVSEEKLVAAYFDEKSRRSEEANAVEHGVVAEGAETKNGD